LNPLTPQNLCGSVELIDASRSDRSRDSLSASGLSPDAIFAEARRLVTWHYQWLVLHDWVERVTQKGIVAKILDHGREFYRFKRTPFMPVEFSAAAYRLGHSMVREVYSHNRIFTQGGLAPATLALLFRFTGLSGGIVGDLALPGGGGSLPFRNLKRGVMLGLHRDRRSPGRCGSTIR
jgi:hypothetical protein